LDAVVDLVILNLGPVRHVELFVHSKAPLVGVVADSATVSLRTHIFAVKSVALGCEVE